METIYKTIIFCYLLLKIGICEGQSLCDTTISDTTAGVWVVTEIMPTCNITAEELEYRVNYDLLLKDFNIGNGTVFKILFYINSKGEDFNYRVLNSDNEKFNKKFIGSIQSNTEWTPAYIIRKNKQIPVDFGLVLEFKIINGKIVYLDKDAVILNKHHYFIKRENRGKEKTKR